MFCGRSYSSVPKPLPLPLPLALPLALPLDYSQYSQYYLQQIVETGSVGALLSTLSPQPCTVLPPLAWAVTWGQQGHKGARAMVGVRAGDRLIKCSQSAPVFCTISILFIHTIRNFTSLLVVKFKPYYILCLS